MQETRPTNRDEGQEADISHDTQEDIRLLLVDDDEVDRMAVRRALSRAGIRADFREAATCAGAKAILAEQAFDCVFLDYHLPDGNGLDILRDIRASGDTTPIIMLTGQGDEIVVAQVMKAGATDYLPKSGISPDLLGRTVRAALRYREAQAQARRALEELNLRDRAIEAASNGIILTDPRQPDCPIVYANPAFLALTGYAAEEVLGRNCRFLQGPDTDARAIQVMRDAIREERPCQVLILNYKKSGESFWNEVTVSPVREAGGGLSRFVGVQTDVTARRELEAERERLLNQTKELLAQAEGRAEREQMVTRIGLAIRASLSPEVIQETAVAVLGEVLQADRCYIVSYDTERDAGHVGEDWRRPDLPSVAGDFRPSVSDGLRRHLFWGGGTAAVSDVRTALPPEDLALLERIGLRSLLAVPFFDKGRLVAALYVGMVDETRLWTPDEVAFLEAVAVQVRTAVETAHIAQREHNIANRLQDALRPELPQRAPGLALADYYQPALTEANVGGDFADVFALSEGRTVLTVGDLSGKGLAAAAQVATVRSMLRFALYNSRQLSDAVMRLNDTISENGLLTGFTTLFVGVYDSRAGTLTYVNCGQEPALIHRAASKDVEYLAPTGPVLGMIDGSAFGSATIPLAAGDVVALFTDGLTEVGPRQGTLLGAEGMADLLREAVTAAGSLGVGAGFLVERLIAGVKSHGRGGVPDDMCLLVAVAVDE